MSTRKSHKAHRPAVFVGAAVAGVLLSGTAAVAYWSVTGAGSGSAASGTMTAPTVSAGTASGTLLYPGLTANGTSTGADLLVSASNPNPFAVTVTVSQGAGAVTGCTTPAVTFSGGSFTLPANSGTVTRTIAKSVSMGTASSNDCQGQTITDPLTTSSTST
jgi:hypothetical protein